VLFDLDGTLADTAPDLAAALNRVRIEDGLAPVAASRLRPFTSQGVRGLLREAYGLATDDERYQDLAQRVLTHYAGDLCSATRLFAGMDALLAELEASSIAWGIVTNKHSRFTLPLVEALGLAQRASAIVSGDTTGRSKPAPDPLLKAADDCSVSPEHCIYVGDDERDIVAARAAGMASIAVRWGYMGTEKHIDAWGADRIIDHPAALMDYLRSEA
jgi:phosphoglycolate phosphatase